MSDEKSATDKPAKSAETPFERAVAANSTTGAAADSTKAPKSTKPAKAADPVVEETVVEETVVETPDETVVVEERAVEVPASEAAPSTTPASTVGTQPQVIYVTQPAPPARKGNRGFGAVAALLSAIVFGLVLALVSALIGYLVEGEFSFGFLSQALFYVPILLFLVGFVLLVLIVNRANWWAYIVGSILVGLFVYFGTVGVGMLAGGVIQDPGRAAELFERQLLAPFVIVSALLAREVSMWVGAAISRRGRTVKARNAEARAAYERDLEEKRAERERLTGVPA